MAFPFFYSPEIKTGDTRFVLGEETSKHAIQVLRMRQGEPLQLTDGKGNLFTTEIIDDNRKNCVVEILSEAFQPASPKKIIVAISLVKNSTRFEWFLEKATEIGVFRIIPMLCSRTEKQHFRHDRMKNILVSAMLQSQQTWLPVLDEPTAFAEVINKNIPQKFMAHCEEQEIKQQLAPLLTGRIAESMILIGPEGDFTKDEIAAALPGVRTALSAGPRGPVRSAGVAGPGGVPDPVHRAILLPAVASGVVDVSGGGWGDDLPDGLHHAEPERREPRVRLLPAPPQRRPRGRGGNKSQAQNLRLAGFLERIK